MGLIKPTPLREKRFSSTPSADYSVASPIVKMYGSIVSMVVQAALAFLLSKDPESRTAVRGLLASLTGTALILGWQLLCVLRAWLATSLEKEPEAPEDSWIDLCGPPRFDPSKGVYGEVLIDGKQHRVVIQPDFWPLLRSAINIDRDEAAVANSIVSSVAPGKEPGSLVCIQAKDGKVIGMGARVHCGPATVLVTAGHVLKKGMIADLYLAKYSVSSKEGKRVLMDPTWKIEYGSLNKEADVISVQVPAAVWSRLGVTAARVRKPTVKVPVLAYGGEASGLLQSSQGFATPDGNMSVAHSCSTRPGWSGTPLYAGSDIVAIHRRWEDIGVKNLATNLSIFHANCESSENGEQGAREIDAEEWMSREVTPTDVYIAGRGKYRVAGDEFSHSSYDPLAFSKYKKERGEMTWADMVEGDLDWDAREESTGNDIPLNCQQAASKCSSPCVTCPESSGVTEKSSPQQACPSLTVEDRVSNLEKLLERVLTSSAETQSNISVISQTLVGLKEARKQKELVCSSKQADSAPQKPPTTSTARAENSSENTPGPSSEPASGGKLGTQKASKKRSKKSRKGTSSGTPVQGSPSA